jgi:hypothetical protein
VSLRHERGAHEVEIDRVAFVSIIDGWGRSRNDVHAIDGNVVLIIDGLNIGFVLRESRNSEREGESGNEQKLRFHKQPSSTDLRQLSKLVLRKMAQSSPEVDPFYRKDNQSVM